MPTGEAEPLKPGEQLAHDLHASLTETNRLLGDVRDLLEANLKIQGKLIEILDDACAYMEVGTTAADILDDVACNGKSLTSKDIVKAIQAATKEVFGDNDEDDEDDDDNGDDDGKDPEPVGSRGRRRSREG